MIEQLRYHTVAELQALSLAELRAMWELVPTDRQRAYRAAYEREVRTAGAATRCSPTSRTCGSLPTKPVTEMLIIVPI
jgi:hypothetical protein